MFFKRYAPDPELEKIIECYWIAEDPDKTPKQQKIIPDGFTEIIIHSGDPYKICLVDHWELQSLHLIAGQIDKHFLLENTGASAIVGIKLKPTALTHLFDLDMHELTNKVVELKSVPAMVGVLKDLDPSIHHHKMIDVLNQFFTKLLRKKRIIETPVDQAVKTIFEHHGMISVASISDQAKIGDRQLENLFKKCVGLSPKLFSRIVRFNYIFELVEKNKGWSDIAYEAAYYDQSHFIRNFKDFTGENPADYAFDEKNMANFFLKRGGKT